MGQRMGMGMGMGYGYGQGNRNGYASGPQRPVLLPPVNERTLCPAGAYTIKPTTSSRSGTTSSSERSISTSCGR